MSKHLVVGLTFVHVLEAWIDTQQFAILTQPLFRNFQNRVPDASPDSAERFGMRKQCCKLLVNLQKISTSKHQWFYLYDKSVRLQLYHSKLEIIRFLQTQALAYYTKITTYKINLEMIFKPSHVPRNTFIGVYRSYMNCYFTQNLWYNLQITLIWQTIKT